MDALTQLADQVLNTVREEKVATESHPAPRTAIAKSLRDLASQLKEAANKEVDVSYDDISAFLKRYGAQ